MKVTYKYRGVYLGSIFTAVQLLLSLTMVFSVLAILPGMGTASLIAAFIGNTPYQKVGYATVSLFTLFILLVTVLTRRSVLISGRQGKEMEDADISAMLLLFNLFIHSWTFYVWWAIMNNFSSDDEIILGAIITFPISSLFSFFFGILIDSFKNRYAVSMVNRNLLTDLNATVDSWIAALDLYSFEDLCAQPAAGSWSMGQMYLHLVGDTGFFVERIRECLQSDQHKDAVPTEDGVAMLAANSFPDMKIEGNPANADIPQPQSIEQIKTDLVNIRKALNDLYTQAARLAVQGKSKHPGLGYFSARQWFQFVDMHFRHHLRQKERIDAFLAENLKSR